MTGVTADRFLFTDGAAGPPCGALTIAIKTSSGTPLYFSSASTEGKVSNRQEEVLIFSMMSADGSFARIIVTISELVKGAMSCAKTTGKLTRHRINERDRDKRDLGIKEDPFGELVESQCVTKR